MALAIIGCGAPAAIAAQPPQPQDEFGRWATMPAPEQIPAAPLLIGAYIVVLGGLFAYVVSLSRRLGAVHRDVERLEADLKRRGRLGPTVMPTAAHFLYIPAVLLLGVVIGWILGSRAAADAYAAPAAEDRKRARAAAGLSARSLDAAPARRQPGGEDAALGPGDVVRRPHDASSCAMPASSRPNAARGSPSRGWPTAPQFTRYR